MQLKEALAAAVSVVAECLVDFLGKTIPCFSLLICKTNIFLLLKVYVNLGGVCGGLGDPQLSRITWPHRHGQGAAAQTQGHADLDCWT